MRSWLFLSLWLLVGCAREAVMQDGFAIRDTIERFHDAVNRRRPAEIAALFVERGVWEVAPPFEHRFEGRTSIERGITGTIEATEVLVQSCGPIVVDLVDATHAKARTSMQEFGRFRDGSSMHVAGTYYDELVQQAGSWRFVQRRFVAHYADELPVPGSALLASSGAQATRGADDAGDRQAISDLIARFASAINTQDLAGAAQLFAEDAIWTSAAGELGFRHEGRAAIADFLLASTANAEALYYLVGIPHVRLLGGGRARSELSMVEVLHIKATDERRLLLGTYSDELVKIDGAWRFRTRHATIRHAEKMRPASQP